MNRTEKIMGPLTVSIISICAAVYIGLAAMMAILQPRFLYFPETAITMTPESSGLPYEDIELDTKDGVRIHGWFIPAENAMGTILFCHGNAGNISHRLDSIEIFNGLGMNVMIFDYRGYGRSGGRPTEAGTYLDARAVWQYLIDVRNELPGNIIPFGRSLGAPIAARLAGETEPCALMIESAFTSVGDIGADLYPYLPVRLLVRFKYDTLRHIRKVRCPVLVAHSHDDEIIPYKHGRRLFAEANEPKIFLEMKGSHNEGFVMSGKEYVEGIQRFILLVKGRVD